MIVKTQGIVLRVIPYSETSRIVTWLTPGYGKLATLMKGSQRAKSLFLGQYDLFHSCEFLFYLRQHHGAYICKECYPLNRRDVFRRDWRGTGCASYFASLITRLCPARAPHAEIFDWLESILDFLAGGREIGTVFFWFELQLLSAMGLAPRLDACLQCQRPLILAGARTGAGRREAVAGKIFFSSARGGVLCARCCSMQDETQIAPDVLGLLRFWQRSENWNSALSSKCTRRQLQAVERVLGLFMQYHLETDIHPRRIALDMLKMKAGRSALKNKQFPDDEVDRNRGNNLGAEGDRRAESKVPDKNPHHGRTDRDADG